MNRALTQIAAVIPRFAETLSVHNTTYPHVAPSSLLPVTGEFGRRKRNPASSVLNGIPRDLYASISPKKRRLDDDASSARGIAGSSNGRAITKTKDAGKLAAPSALGRAKPRVRYVMTSQPFLIQLTIMVVFSGDADSVSAYEAINGYSGSRSGSRIVNGKAVPQPPKASTSRSRTNGDSGRPRVSSGLLEAVASRGGGNRAFEDDDYATTAAGSSRRSPNIDDHRHNGNGNGTHMDPDYQVTTHLFLR